MAEIVTIARPYADATFRLASEQNALDRWSAALSFLAQVAADPQIVAVRDDPRVSADQLAQLLTEVSGGRLDDQAINLVKMLAENGRLAALGEIARLFEELRAEREGALEAHVVSAFPMDDAQSRELADKLSAKYNKRVQVKVSVDPALIGGVRVTLGDEVIDASVRGRLGTLATTLKS